MTFDLSGFGYRRDERSRVWARSGGDDFAYNDGDAEEIWVADAVRDAADVSSWSTELEQRIRDWPSLYHLSHQRANVIRPFLDTVQGPVLELGAGTGAVTRALGERGVDVVAVEGSPRRAAVCAERCRDLPNVQVVADTAQGFGQPAQFATVVLVGVLEYSRMFGFEADGRDPVDIMLGHVGGLIAPGGELILAIENQLGLKYFAGFPEDHIGRRMVGVEDGYGPQTAVTFGRRELSAHLAGAGLDAQEWYFPFPDYKLPTTVLSAQAFDPDSGFDAGPLVVGTARGDHQEPAVTVLDLASAWGPVHRNGLVPDLANSFLVRARRNGAEPRPHPLAWYFGAGSRRPEFRKVTVFERATDGIVVRRQRCHPDLPDTVGPVALRLEDEDYTLGQPWSEELRRIVARSGWSTDEVSAWFAVWFAALTEHLGLGAGEAGPHAVVPGSLLDALPRNLVVTAADRRSFIDLEWETTTPLSLEFLVFRALYDALASVGPVASPADDVPATLGALITAVADRHGIALEPAGLVRAWHAERAFQSVVIGRPVTLEASDVLDVPLPRRRDLDAVIASAVGGEDLRRQVDELRSLEATLREEIDRRGQEIDRRAHDIAWLRGGMDALHTELEQARTAQHELGVSRGRVDRNVEAILAELEAVRGSLRARQAELARARDAAGKARAAAATVRAELDALHDSRSWRVTRPIRAARRRGAGLKRVLRDGQSTNPQPGPSAAPASPSPKPPKQRAATRGGRRQGLPPAPAQALAAATAELDLDYYRARYDDLANLSDAELLNHYALNGSAEGRRPRSVLDDASITVRSLDPERDTVLLVCHEATRTGAPVLGWNLAGALATRVNVVVVLLRGGALQEEFREQAAATVVFDGNVAWNVPEAEIAAARLVERFRPRYAIANSAATHALAPSLERAGVPVVGLVHEFASSIRPSGVLADMFASLSALVFPAEIVADSMRKEYRELLARAHVVLPQGQSALPAGDVEEHRPRVTRRGTDGVEVDLPEVATADYLAELDPATVLVVGAGTISPRKGVEFFVQTADAIRRNAPDADIRFAWIGDRIEPLQWYVEEIHQQVVRSGVGSHVAFLGTVSDLAPLYERADVFFLSSRLDPLPNVTIDAATAGIPVVAFDGASGMADLLTESGLEQLVAPHLDVTGAARIIEDLARDTARRQRAGEDIRTVAARHFDMERYAESLDALGRAAAASRSQASDDVRVILDEGDFDAEMYAGADHGRDTADVVREYVATSRVAAPRRRQRAGLLVRRPAAGFNPLVYAEQRAGYDDDRDGDPYADFLRRGRPDGPWLRRVIRPGDAVPTTGTPPRVLVHGHFHYPELVGDLVARLRLNRHPVDLHLTTTDAAKAAELEDFLASSGLDRWTVEEVPNRGRDLGPLVTSLGQRLDDYDLVLHLHGKRSPHVEGSVADRWRDFLWENLVGGRERMLDTIVDAFAADPGLGLVSPEDPHLNDWDLNRQHGEQLAARFGVSGALPNHFDFPLGAMFWVRPRALAPILDAKLAWEDYPAEPVPIDGTMLHALERVIPFVVEAAGFGYAKTVVPGVTR